MYAYYLSKQILSNFEEQYEIKIIHLFLARFFCDYEQIIFIFNALDIKNVLLKNFTYIWSNIYIKFINNQKIKNCFLQYEVKYYNWNKVAIKQINTMVLQFIDEGHLQHAIELLETRKSLIDDPILKEFKERKFFDLENDYIYNDLLSKHASYIFKKSTNESMFDNFQAANIFKKVHRTDNVIYNIFNNKFKKINCTNFIRSMIKLQNDLAE